MATMHTFAHKTWATFCSQNLGYIYIYNGSFSIQPRNHAKSLYSLQPRRDQVIVANRSRKFLRRMTKMPLHLFGALDTWWFWVNLQVLSTSNSTQFFNGKKENLDRPRSGRNFFSRKWVVSSPEEPTKVQGAMCPPSLDFLETKKFPYMLNFFRKIKTKKYINLIFKIMKTKYDYQKNNIDH